MIGGGRLIVGCAALLCPHCGMHVAFETTPAAPLFEVTVACEPCRYRVLVTLPTVQGRQIPWVDDKKLPKYQM